MKLHLPTENSVYRTFLQAQPICGMTLSAGAQRRSKTFVSRTGPILGPRTTVTASPSHSPCFPAISQHCSCRVHNGPQYSVIQALASGRVWHLVLNLFWNDGWPSHTLQARASFGSKATEPRRVTITSGSGDIGSVRHLKGRTGTHPHDDHYREGWEWHGGHRDREDHDNGRWPDHHGRGQRDHNDHEHEHDD